MSLYRYPHVNQNPSTEMRTSIDNSADHGGVITRLIHRKRSLQGLKVIIYIFTFKLGAIKQTAL
jgi:hypothetical protein